MLRTVLILFLIITVFVIVGCNVSLPKKRIRSKRLLPGSPNNVTDQACKEYNDNLSQVWQFLNSQTRFDMPEPDKGDLYNLALALKAHLQQKETARTRRTTNTDDTIENALADIRQLIVTNNTSVIKIVHLIRREFKHVIKQPDNVECHKINKENLIKFTKRALYKYLKAIPCRRSTDEQAGEDFVVSEEISEKSLRSKENCREVALDSFMNLMKGVVNRYIIGSRCIPDETI